MFKIVIPNEVFEKLNINTPKIRGFYKHKNSVGLSETKNKYKICYEELRGLDTFSFLITTSKDNGYTECFSFEKKHINNLVNQPGLTNVGYVNIGRHNELYEFKSKKEFSDLFFSKDIEKIGLLHNKKYIELKKLLTKSQKAKVNYKASYSLLVEDFGDDFISKYKI